MKNEQWYSNKDLFEQINALSAEMRETRTMIRQYNGLRDDLANVEKRITTIEQQAKGRHSVGKAVREWGGWLIAVLAFVFNILWKA